MKTNKLWWEEFAGKYIYRSLWGHGTSFIKCVLADIKMRGGRYQLTVKRIPTETVDSEGKPFYWEEKLAKPYQKTVDELDKAKEIVESYIGILINEIR